MAATGYASLVSLLNTMDQVQIHPRLSTCFSSFQFQSLRQKLDLLLDFVENRLGAVIGEDIDADSTEGEALLSRIADVAQMAEGEIEVQAADRIRDGFLPRIRRSAEVMMMKEERWPADPQSLHGLEKIIDAMDSIIKEEVMKMKEGNRFADRPHTSAMTPSPSSSTAKSTAVVGFKGYLERVMADLTGHDRGRQILPIVGMGGIGKTTLAKSVYEHSSTLCHFYVRVWITVSQTFSVGDILSQALSCLTSLRASTDVEDIPSQALSCVGASTDVEDSKLGVELYQLLFNRRYLIVLDDVWRVEAWEKIQFFFPENNNRSRIVVTTRQGEVVDYFRSSALAMDFLNKNDSWELFCGKAFAGEGCPHELEEVGRKIVKKCKGLPLAICVIGGLMSKSPKMQQYWEEMAKDKSLVSENSEEGNKALSILYLSYKHLPACLKPCFLHVGLFPEDDRIDPSFLVKLWVAEGFIKPKKFQSLEQVAESYIKELVDRNLLLVEKKFVLTGVKKVEFCSVHDFVREVCIRIGKKEQFYCARIDIDGRNYPRSKCLTSSERPSVMNPVILNGLRKVLFKSRLLRVLVDDDDDDTNSLTDHFEQINLRFFSRKRNYSSRSLFCEFEFDSIPLCWSLQTIICKDKHSVNVPNEIWKMPQLRHIMFGSVHIPDPHPDDNSLALPNLQTLERVENLNFNEEVCKRIPNIKELAVQYKWDRQGGCFSCLNKLESLEYMISGSGGLVQGLKLPNSLKGLSLDSCHLVQSDMEMIASLPHLEVLELSRNGWIDTTWDLVEGEFVFVSLKHLKIGQWVALENWVADSSNFPVLESLGLWNVKSLKEIPSSFGEIPTLERLLVSHCSESVMTSAINIQEEQESLGNLNFHLTLNVFYSSQAQWWRAKIQELGITSQNFHVTY